MTATLTIDLRECDTLHGLLSRRLLILVQNPSGLAEAEGISVAELYERLADDLRLMEDIGWAAETDQAAVGLTVPPEKLAEILRRLRSDARRSPLSPRHEREPKESVDERWRRFRQAVEVCEELLCGLASSAQDDADPEPITGVSPEDAARHELAAYYPVTDGFVLAALERAERHEQEAEALTSALMAHLGFKWARRSTQGRQRGLENGCGSIWDRCSCSVGHWRYSLPGGSPSQPFQEERPCRPVPVPSWLQCSARRL